MKKNSNAHQKKLKCPSKKTQMPIKNKKSPVRKKLKSGPGGASKLRAPEGNRGAWPGPGVCGVRSIGIAGRTYWRNAPRDPNARARLVCFSFEFFFGGHRTCEGGRPGLVQRWVRRGAPGPGRLTNFRPHMAGPPVRHRLQEQAPSATGCAIVCTNLQPRAARACERMPFCAVSGRRILAIYGRGWMRCQSPIQKNGSDPA